MSGGLVCLAVALLAWPVPARQRSGTARVGPLWRRGFRGPRSDVRPLLAAFLAGAVAGAVSTVLVGCLVAVCAGLAVRAHGARRREARTAVVLQALAELLAALAAELRSGRPVQVALDAALRACGDEECRRLAEPVLRAAGEGGAAPHPGGGAAGTPAEFLHRVAAAVRLSSRTGCSLAAVLGAVEDDLRARSRSALEARSATAGPRASAAVLAGLPVLALAMGGGVGADPWRVLTTTPPGQALLVIGVALELAGISWSARLVRRALA